MAVKLREREDAIEEGIFNKVPKGRTLRMIVNQL
jgi:hypothetical protein